MSTNQNPFIGNLEPGLHDFYLIVKNENGCGSQTFAVTQVEIFAEPVISAVSGDGTYCQGETVTLSAINTVPTQGSMNYTWSGPNGFIYTGTSDANGPFDLILPNISPDFEGSYTLSLTTEDGCMTTTAQSVNVDLDATPMTPSLAANTNLVCEGEIIELTSTAYTGTPVVYTWTYTDDNGNVTILGDTDNPTFFITDVADANTGVYSVIVMVDGCSSQPSNGELITVFSNVAPPITANPTSAMSPACMGDNIDLSVPLIPGATYEWFGPNGFNSTLPNPVIINIDENGVGDYYVVVELNGCATVVSETTTVYVQERPISPTIVNNGPWCEGSELVLSVSSQLDAPSGMTVSFDWYNAATNALIGTTEDPTLTIEDVDASFTGEYYVVYTLGQCSALPSEVTAVQIDAIPNNAADAGEDVDLCASQVVMLDAEAPTSGTGFWSSTTGATIANPELANAEASDLIEGENIFIWTLSQGECRDYDSDTMSVMVNLLPVDIAFAGNDIDKCGGSADLALTANIPTEATGIWSQSPGQAALGVVIVDPTDPNTEITGMVFGNQYLFTWTLSLGTCENYSIDEVMVSVSESPENNAFVYENTVFSCGGETLNLSALEPTTGFGKWSTSSLGRIIDPFESETIVDDLPMGRSVFVWSLSAGDCENYSQDSIVIYREDEIVTQGESYEVAFGDTLRNMNIMLNDFVGNVEEWELTLITEPRNGILVGDFTTGMFEYQPDAAFFGEDQFEYQICNVNCPDECSTAIVNIKVNGQDQTGECWIPNIMTPNGDGDNDAFVVPCLDAYPDNEIRVYNRWGDLVYRKNGYANDWEGTFNGALLPSGTYFYIIRLAPEDTEETQGYFTIFR